MSGWEWLQLRFFQTLPYFLLLGFGYTKLLIGESRGRPVGYLTMFLILTAILAFIRFAALDRRTRAGQEVLAEARDRHRDEARAISGCRVLVVRGARDRAGGVSRSSGAGGPVD